MRLHLSLDGRFEIVGEASDGIEAVELAERTHPDLLLIDRQMPRLTGIEAMPRIHEVSPETALVLYTSDDDYGIHQAAVAAGALDVVMKDRPGEQLIDDLTSILLRHWSESLEHPVIKIGPTPSAAALAWTDCSIEVLRVLREHPELLDQAVNEKVFDTFDRFLRLWRELASTADVFVWAAQFTTVELDEMLQAFAAMDRVPEAKLAEIGCRKSVPEGDPFFEVITKAVLDTVRQHDAMSELAAMLTEQWHDGE